MVEDLTNENMLVLRSKNLINTLYPQTNQLVSLEKKDEAELDSLLYSFGYADTKEKCYSRFSNNGVDVFGKYNPLNKASESPEFFYTRIVNSSDADKFYDLLSKKIEPKEAIVQPVIAATFLGCLVGAMGGILLSPDYAAGSSVATYWALPGVAAGACGISTAIITLEHRFAAKKERTTGAKEFDQIFHKDGLGIHHGKAALEYALTAPYTAIN